MKMQVTAHGMELTTELRDHVERRVGFALGRFSQRIDRLTVRLVDVNGPRGGVDKSCLMRVDAGLTLPLLICERQYDIRAAVDLAAERAGRNIERRLRLDRKRGR